MPARKTRGRPPHPDLLTPAEWRVTEGVRHGLSNPVIAARMSVSADAIKFHISNILGKLDLPDRRALRLWDGVRRESVLLRQSEQAAFGGLGPIGQIARTVRDVEVSTLWYRDTLGLDHLFSADGMAFFDCAGVRLMLAPSSDVGVANAILYFTVADIKAATRELKQRGVALRSAPHMIYRHPDGAEEWMAFFDDPDGAPLGLMSVVAGAQQENDDD